MRKHGRIDDNQSEIVSTFRKLGFSVESLASQGNGVPDLLIGKGGINYLVEVKDGSKPPSKKKLTEDEKKWHDDWRGQVTIIETIDQAIKFDLNIKENK